MKIVLEYDKNGHWVSLEQTGRWFSLYVDGSLKDKNMSREVGTKMYFSYVKALESAEEASK